MGKRGVGRRAQLTVLIMIGLLLVVVTSLALYVYYNVGERPLLPLVPPEVRPVYDLMTGCVRVVGEPAVRRMAAQGGYLEIPPAIDKNPTSYVALDDGGQLKVPLWFYDGEVRVPPVDFMQRQLENEITQRMGDCIGDFSALGPQFNVQPEGNLRVNVTLGKDSVIVRVNYPLSWQSAGKEVKYEDFIAFLPVKLLEMWSLANATLMAENEGTFIENATIDLMAIDKEVPLDGMSIDCSQQRWRLPEIKTHLQDVLKINLATIRFKNTDHVPFEQPAAVYERLRTYTMEDINAGRTPPNVPDDAYEYLRLYWDVRRPAPDLRAALTYEPRWGMALTANPNDNGILESKVAKGGGGYLDLICVNSYHFTYDMIYPVLMTVRDDSAFDDTGVVFHMAMPVQIKTNAPNRVTYGTSSFRGFSFGTEFCEDLGDRLVDLRAQGVLADDRIASDLDGVNFTLRCVTRDCALGASIADQGIYRLRTLLPQACALPTIVASRSGFIDSVGQLEGDALTLDMRALRNVKISVVKHPYDTVGKTLGAPLPLGSSDNVSIRISIQNSSFDQFLLYPVNDTIQLADGSASYDVTLLLSQFGQLTGGFSQEGITLDSTGGSLVFHVLEGRPIANTDDYRNAVGAALYGEQYQTQLAPEAP